jgi:hypothetical protein
MSTTVPAESSAEVTATIDVGPLVEATVEVEPR